MKSTISPAPLESILRTAELHRRATRQPDYVTENRALVTLTRSLADAPDTILQTLAETICEVLNAGSAVVSLLTENEERFHWSAIAGLWKQHIGGGTPRNFSPCGDVLDCNAPLLLAHIERRYAYFEPMTPPLDECLLVPFHVAGKSVGTIWAVAHDAHRKFDSEDLRQLENLSLFASVAYQAQTMAARNQRHAASKLDDALQTSHTLEQHNVQLLLSTNALRRSEAELRDFVENASVGLQWVGPDGNVLWANQTELDLLGYTREEYVGHNITEFYADRPVIEDMLVRLTGGETLHDHEARMRSKDGSIRHVVVSSNAYVKDGKFVHTRCFTRDITARKKAAAALRASEERVGRALDAAQLGTFNIDVTTNNLTTDKRFLAIFGTTADRIDYKEAFATIHPDDRERQRAAVAAATRAVDPVAYNEEYRVVHSDGTLRWVFAKGRANFAQEGPVRRLVSLDGTVADITDRKHAAEALRESQRFLRSSLDALSGHIVILDELGVILEVNEAWRRFADQNQFTGIDHGVGANYLQHCEQTFPQTGNAQSCISGINDVINGRQTRFEMEYPCHSPTEQRWFVMRVTRFHSPGPVRIVIVHDNCTERKLAESTLRASEEFNRSIIKSSPDCIKVLDLDGNLLSMLSGQALLGIEDIRPFLNKSWVDFWQGDDRQAAQTAINAAATGAAGQFVGFFRTLSGESRWWDVAISPILDATGKPERLLSVSRDVTQHTRAELNLAFLAGVNRDLALWMNVDEMMRIVGAKIAAYFKLSSCAFVEINEAADQVEVRYEWHREDIPSLVGVYRLGDFVSEEFILLARAGETIIVRNTDNDPRTSPKKFEPLKIAAFICEPLIRDDQWCFALCLNDSVPHDWRQDEIELSRELTARIWTRLERLRADAALSASEEKYRTVFNSMDEGLCVIEMIFDAQDNPVDYLFLEVNASFENHTGMNDAPGKRVRELVPDIEPYWIELYGKIALTGEPARYVNVVKGLGDRWLDVYAFRIGGPGTKKIAVLLTNITERTKTEDALRQSEARFRALFDRGPIGMYSCDLSGKTVAYNRVAAELWGLEPKPGESDEQIRGSFQLFLTDGTPLAIADTPMTQVLQGKAAAVHDQQIVFARPDGSRITMVSNIVPLKNERGEITGVIDCFYDITERSLLEKKTFEQAQALTDLHRRKDEFLAMLSHELRNPLAPISNAVHLLRMQKNEGPIQQQARSIIERQVGQLTHLIDDLMEVSRITTGRIHLHEENITLSGILENAVETVRPLIDRHRHSLKLALPPAPIWLHADAARLEQVVVNLLTNAVKYTDNGGTITLSMMQDEDEAVIRVKDTGVGISAELLPRIFELFTQADRSLDRSQGGLGIGLCLVKRLVEMHRGTVTAQSTFGNGSEFEVRLPVVEDSALTPALVAAIPLTAGEMLRVLIVEDNLDAAETLTMLLELSGHGVRATNNGLAALQAALEFRPHVVLLDIGLPGMDGFAIARQLRDQPALAGIVLVAMTGYGEVLARKRSREAGFDHHLVKPADFGKVQEILASVSHTETLAH